MAHVDLKVGPRIIPPFGPSIGQSPIMLRVFTVPGKSLLFSRTLPSFS